MASPAQLKLDLKDRDGKPVQGAKVSIDAQWPGDPKFDFKVVFNEVAPGNYVGDMKFSRAGNWDLLISAQQETQEFEMEQKIFVAIPKQP